LVELSLAGDEGVPALPNLACIIDYSDLGGFFFIQNQLVPLLACIIYKI